MGNISIEEVSKENPSKLERERSTDLKLDI